MGKVISFFTWLWNGVKSMFDWLRSIPAILVGSIVGFATSINTLIGSLSSNSTTYLNEALTVATNPATYISTILDNAPDIVKLSVYAVSLDVLFRFVLSAFILFTSATILVLGFQLVTFLSFLAVLYTIKMAAWFINAFFPNSFSISGVKSIASIDATKIEVIDL